MRTHAVTKTINVLVCMHFHGHNEHYCHISELQLTSMLRVPIKKMLTSLARLLAVVSFQPMALKEILTNFPDTRNK